MSGVITVSSSGWSEWAKESSGQGFDALNNRVIVGREHKGDENGLTRYATALVRFNGKDCMTCDRVSSSSVKESKGIWCCSDSERVMTGRHHTGDENGQTYYNYSKLYILEPSTEPAPKGTRIVPDRRMQSESMKESKSSFLCPSNMVLTGRLHSGDENGATDYTFSSLTAKDVNGTEKTDGITVEDLKWTEWHTQSESPDFFVTTEMQDENRLSRIITGREHVSDENGMTRYQSGLLKYNGKLVRVVPYPNADMCIYESQGKTVYPKENLVIIGIKHSGDENGITTFCQGYIVADK